MFHLAAQELSRWPVWEQLCIQVRSSGAMLELAEEIREDKGQLKLWGPGDEQRARCGHTCLKSQRSGSRGRKSRRNSGSALAT